MLIISREEAARRGLKRFFTGEPCRHGHVAERWVGCRGRCVECTDTHRKKYREDNPERVREKRLAYDKKNREVRNEQARAWQKKNPEKVKAALRRWHANNQEQQRAYQRGRKDQRNESNRRRRRERHASDPVFAMQNLARARVYSAFRRIGYRKDSPTSQLIGCSWPELKRHIEKQFLRGMTWANRGTAWHVDHIQAIGEATTAEEIAALCHFTNLRPLWALDNWKKNAKRTHLI